MTISATTVKEGFYRLSESLQQIPRTPPRSDPDEEDKQDDNTSGIDAMPHYMPEGSGEHRDPAAPWSMVNPVGLTETCKEFVTNAATNVRLYAKRLIDFIKQCMN